MSGDYNTHLTSGVTTLCWCWLIERTDGQSLGFTDHDLSLRFEGVDFEPDAGFDSTAMQSKLGIGPNNSEVMGALSSARITPKDVHAGRFKGAQVKIWRVNWRDIGQRKLHFSGHLGEITHNNQNFTAELRGLGDQLNQSIGRRYLRQCTAQLGDQTCRVNLDHANYRRNAQVISSPARHIIYIDQMHDLSDGWFSNGRVQINSGENQGVLAVIANDRIEGNRRCLTLVVELPFDLSTGDNLRLTTGCHKTSADCRDKFSNLINYQGFPFIPGEDWMLAYPKSN